MKIFLTLLIVAILGVPAAGGAAETAGCPGCDSQKQESTHREQIKADRAKYDRENEKVTARPWDGIKDDKPQPNKDK
jgi:hypothetical protein